MNKKVPVSIGEYIDKVTILAIKSSRIKNNEKLRNVLHELNTIVHLDSENIIDTPLYRDLMNVNKKLWDVEDAIRIKEREESFGDEFIDLARSVYKLNDERSRIKKDINLKYGSNLIEEKSYDDSQ